MSGSDSNMPRKCVIFCTTKFGQNTISLESGLSSAEDGAAFTSDLARRTWSGCVRHLAALGNIEDPTMVVHAILVKCSKGQND